MSVPKKKNKSSNNLIFKSKKLKVFLTKKLNFKLKTKIYCICNSTYTFCYKKHNLHNSIFLSKKTNTKKCICICCDSIVCRKIRYL